MISLHRGRSRSRDRKHPPQNVFYSPPVVGNRYAPSNSEFQPLAVLYPEVSAPKYPRAVLRKDRLTKSHSLSSKGSAPKPDLINKITSSVSKLRRHKDAQLQKEQLAQSTSLPSSLSSLPQAPPSIPVTPPSDPSSIPTAEDRVSNNNKRRACTDEETEDRDVTCAICLEILYRPRQLTCGHAFCLICLQMYSNSCSTKLTCPSCRQIIEIPLNGVSDLPRNFKLEKAVELINEKRKNMVLKAKICTKCHGEENVRECHHCSKGWCYTCYQVHAKDVHKEFLRLKECLMESKETLLCKQEEEETRFGKLEDKIKEAIEMKREELISKVQTLREERQKKVSHLSTEVQKKLESVFSDKKRDMLVEEEWKQYKEINQLLDSISSSGEPRLTFDITSLTLRSTEGKSSDNSLTRRTSNVGDDDKEGECDEERFIIPKDPGAHYRVKNSFSKYKWGQNVCSRPAGLAISPWNGLIYVTASDSCKVHIFDQNGKQVSSFGFRGQKEGGFMCPIGIAFSSRNKEIYITDKWKHCIHVFDSEGRFLRQMGHKGKGMGAFFSPEGIATDLNGNIYVADTCNDRVQVLDSDGVFLREIGVISSEILGQGKRYTKREFNEPVGIAVSPDGLKICVADSGNHRIRVFDGRTGERTFMFGSQGPNRAQFESPEGVAIDDEGFIIVADSGNGRVQIFRPNGLFVRALGSKGNKRGEFGWVSGLALNNAKDIIVADFKNNTLALF